jgi:hypothetical protein
MTVAQTQDPFAQRQAMMFQQTTVIAPMGNMRGIGIPFAPWNGTPSAGGAGRTLPPAMEARLDAFQERLNAILSRVTEMLNELGGERRLRAFDSSSSEEGGSSASASPGQVIKGEGRIWGDPHFIGADGGKYDVQGQAGKVYNLLSDQGFQMNGRFDKYDDKGATVVGQVGIRAGSDVIEVSKAGRVTVNGQEVKDGQKVRLADGGFVERDGKEVTVKSGEWTVEFQANGRYLNMDVKTENANADGVKPHGLLGQSFDGDGIARNGDKGKGAQGGGAIETMANTFTEAGDKLTIHDYEVDGIHDVGFMGHNRFGDGSVTVGGGSDTEAFNARVAEMMRDFYGRLSQSILMSAMSFYNENKPTV